MTKLPTVSVVCITYNHEKYIHQALDGFVKQKTNFTYEVIVADDYSTDKTAEIIAEYAKNYPEIIKPTLRTKNVGIEKNCIEAFQKTTGKYVAFCEGDDYWTDTEKLQTQVDFMELNQGCALSFHPVKVFFEDGSKQDYIFPDQSNRKNFSSKRLLEQNYIQSNSVMYRKQDYKKLPEVLPMDWYLHLYHATFGSIGFIDKTMSAYRKHSGGVWWESDSNIDEIWKKYGLAHVKLFIKIRELYAKDVACVKVMDASIDRMINTLIDVDINHKTRLVKQLLLEFPDIATSFTYSNRKLFKTNEASMLMQNHELSDLKKAYQEQSSELQQKASELKLIKSSKLWRLRNMTTKRKRKNALE